jgi:RNA polymerase sigma-70 factor (ECF subfamily)
MSVRPLSSPAFEPAAPVREAEAASDAAQLNRVLAQRLRDDPARGTAEIHAHFAADVNRLVWRLLGADPDHNDVVQQIFCKIMLNGHRLREPERLAAWVQSITVNTVYEELRRRDVRRVFQRDSNNFAFHPDLVRDVEVRDLLLRAKQVIERLPAKERIVFLLHFVEGRPLAEVAELCDYSLATAKRRLNSANRRFNALVGKNPDLVALFARREGREK